MTVAGQGDPSGGAALEGTPAGGGEPGDRTEAMALLATVFLVAACGLVYELLLGTVSSYLIGSSVTQFSLCIGTFVGAMGLGSWLSQWIERGLLRWFLGVEVALSLVGGLSAWAITASYVFLGSGYWFVLFGVLIVIGALVGIELPLLTRLLARYGTFRSVIANALSFDYVGALLGSIAFPLVLLPWLGTTRTAFLIGLVNLGAAAINLHVFRRRLRGRTGPAIVLVAIAVAMGAGLLVADRATRWFEQRLYDDQVLLATQTRYQRIVLTRNRNDLRLYLDGNLQFSSVDEYRYHEALVHPAMAAAPSRREVLILGGGDGLGLREVLRWKDVRRATLVDIDPEMTRLGRRFPALRTQNGGAFEDPRVRLVHADAFKFLETDPDLYDVVVADLPDPNNEVLARLYTNGFHALVRRRLARGGLFVTQATSPLFAREAFWCIDATLRSEGYATAPYHAYVPSFGDWGWILARPGKVPVDLARHPAPAGMGLRFVGSGSAATLTAFDADTARVNAPVCRTDRLEVLRLYERGVRQWETN
ncbi:MAG: polyamine aminopropyltransferase [Armatimonadota bacterium]